MSCWWSRGQGQASLSLPRRHYRSNLPHPFTHSAQTPLISISRSLLLPSLPTLTLSLSLHTNKHSDFVGKVFILIVFERFDLNQQTNKTQARLPSHSFIERQTQTSHTHLHTIVAKRTSNTTIAQTHLHEERKKEQYLATSRCCSSQVCWNEIIHLLDLDFDRIASQFTNERSTNYHHIHTRSTTHTPHIYLNLLPTQEDTMRFSPLLLLPLLSLVSADTSSTSSTTTVTSTATMTRTITISQVIAAVTSTYAITNSTTSAILATGTGATSLTSAAAATSASKTLPANYMGAATNLNAGMGVMGGALVGVVGLMLL